MDAPADPRNPRWEGWTLTVAALILMTLVLWLALSATAAAHSPVFLTGRWKRLEATGNKGPLCQWQTVTDPELAQAFVWLVEPLVGVPRGFHLTLAWLIFQAHLVVGLIVTGDLPGMPRATLRLTGLMVLASLAIGLAQGYADFPAVPAWMLYGHSCVHAGGCRLGGASGDYTGQPCSSQHICQKRYS